MKICFGAIAEDLRGSSLQRKDAGLPSRL